MADLNSTIVRGKLRVTEDINTNGNIVGSSIIGSGSGLTNLNASNISSGTLSMDRHYSPTADKGSELTATLPGEAGAYAKDTEYTVLTGVKAQRDAKGHVTGLTYTAQKIKDTNTTYTFNGAVSTIKDSNLTASRALISDNSGKIAVSDVTSAELSYLDGVTSSVQTQLNAKLDKTTYEWNKEFVAGSNGAISLGRYNIYDSQLTFDITSTTNQSLSGKLVIATQNGTIHQAKVFGDASGALVSKLIIYQSAISNSRSWVEVFCNFNGWSKNKVHVYAVALNSATVQKQMTSVTISNGVPAAANVTSGDTKWTGTIVNDFSHSHGISIKEASSGANKLTLAHGTKYALTAGGQSFIFTTPSDTNTWRGIQDNLTSDSTTDSLSAKQGKELKKLVDGKSDSGHTHNYAGSSSAGGIANSAKELGMLFYKASERAGAEGYYKIATIMHKTWSYCSFTMFTANSYSGAKFNTLFDVRCSDNADSLNGFAFNIIGGTDISNKLKYLETKSGENITKIEIFMQCSRYEHPKFYLVTSSTSNGLAINTTDWGDTPDMASGTAMTGSAANTIKAAALTISAGSNTKPIYFNNGVPTACNYALEKAVPSDAVFTDTKNTAGSMDDTGKLYLVGAKSQAESGTTYSNSNVYMTNGTLATNTLKTEIVDTKNRVLDIRTALPNVNYNIATFKSYTNGETEGVLNGHLIVCGNDDSSNLLKPADKTGINKLDTYYFNTGITLDAGGDAEDQYKLSFPGKSGTFLLDSDLVELTLTNNGTKRYLIGSALANTWSDIGTNSSCYAQSGSLYATYFYGTSDRRLKENIKDLDLNCLDLVNNINLREFSWKADKEHKPTIGAVAQELRQVLPEKYVHEFIGGQETDDEYLSINDSKLVYLLIGAIQEQQKEIENLKAKIDGKIV